MENENPIRKSIEDLLKEDSSDLPVPSQKNLPSYMENAGNDYGEMKDTASNESKKLMNSLLKFYLSQEIIEKNEYIKLKAQIDMMTQANLIKQLQISERAIDTLMRSIDVGEFSPRLFEVLGGLQKTMLDIMRHQTLHMMAIEENMKKLKRDIDIYQDSPDQKMLKIGNKTSVRGTRNLMMEIQEELGRSEIEENADFEQQTEL